MKRTTKAILRMATAEDVEDSEQNSVDDLTSERNKLFLERIQLASDLLLSQDLSLEPLANSVSSDRKHMEEMDQR